MANTEGGKIGVTSGRESKEEEEFRLKEKKEKETPGKHKRPDRQTHGRKVGHTD